MDNILQFMKTFVEGDISGEEFLSRLDSDTELQNRMYDPTRNWDETYIVKAGYGSVEKWLQVQRRRGSSDIGFLLDLQGFLDHFFLAPAGVSYTPTPIYHDEYDIMLGGQPSWLDIDTGWIKDHVLSQAGEMKKTALKKWLKEHLMELFKYVKRPPKWIQRAEWPMKDNRPLVFLGQFKLEASEYFHDDGAVYVFLDPESGDTKAIIQQY